MIIIGHQLIDGVPYINGRPASHDPMPIDDVMVGILSDYRCPDCRARLSASRQICLNACHLPTGTYFKFLAGLRSAHHHYADTEDDPNS